MFNNQIISGSSGQGGGFYDFTIDQSLRFEESGTANLTFTPSNNGTDNKKFTYSVWIKRGQESADDQHLIQSKNTGSGTGQGHVGLFIDDSSKPASLDVYSDNGAGIAQGTRVLRDHGAWYHIVFVYDTTQATSTDRIKIYVNGVEDTNSGYYPSQNTTISSMNVNGRQQYIGKYVAGFSRYFNGYMAEIHMVDGQALDATYFGEEKNGVWVPKKYTDNGTTSHGVNGYHLDFADSSAIGNDVSGNNNDWTANNLAASDVVSDTPTNSFCTLNPLTHGTYPTLSEGNLKIASVYSADLCGVTSTWFPTTGKWYWEIHSEGSTLTYPYFGITDQRQVLTNTTKGSFYSVAWLRTGGSAAMTGTNTYMGTITKNNVTSWTNNDIIMFALDVDARKLWIGKNGTWDGSGDPAAGTGEDASWTVDTGVSPSFMGYNNQGLASVFNFGQDGTFNGNQTAQGNADGNGVGDFYYSPPTGFLAMATSNLDITIGPGQSSQSDDNFNTVLYTGDADNDVTVTNTFAADWVWLKSRSASSTNHYLQDIVRGFGASKSLSSNATGTEGYNGGAPSSQNIVTSSSSLRLVSTDLAANSVTYVAWTWKAGGTAVSNTDGTNITSSVSANPDAGMSIVSWTGTGVGSDSVGHGLTQKPDMVICKSRTSAGANYWHVNHKDLTASDYNIFLNLPGAETDVNTNYAEGGIGLGDADVIDFVAGYSGANNVANCNNSGTNYIAYCFHSVEGFSRVDKFYGTGISNGPYVAVGFRPAWVMVKRADSTGWWGISDSARSTYNEIANTLAANNAESESSLTSDLNVDFLSNGFKIRDTDGYYNASGGTYLYLAFAESPLKYSLAR